MVTRVQEDRLLRWSAYATAPFAWLALALLNPLVLLVPAFAVLALQRAMAYGIVSRADPVPDPDDF